MKKTLSILALAALASGSSMGEEVEKVITVSPKFPLDTQGRYVVPSTQYGGTIAPKAMLVDSSTGGVVTYDEADDVDVIKAPFNINEGVAFTTLTLNLSDIVLDDANKLIIDFTDLAGSSQPQTWAMYLEDGHMGEYDKDNTPDNVDYLLIKIEGFDFASWYQKNSPVEIIGRFIDEIEYYPSSTTAIKGWTTIESTAFVVTDPCLEENEGSVVFFSEDVIDDVKDSEVIPEPTTATLSLLALAGLVARRRRK